MRKAKLAKTKRTLNKYYAVYYKGKLELYLSPNLAVKQNLDIDDLENIKKIHINRLTLFDKIEAESNISKLHKLADELTEIEFKLQDAWKFDRDASFHSWWFQSPKCTCPKLDNQERIGTGYFIVNESCLLHGKKSVKNMYN